MNKNLSLLSESELVNQAKFLVADERRVTLELIEYLREIERRMTFAQMGYGSLFDFAVRHLGLSEGSAHRRISAMRIVHEIPAARDELRSGALSLSNAAKLHVALRAVKKKRNLTISEKSKLVGELVGLSQRECDLKLFERLPEIALSGCMERERSLNAEQSELKLVVSRELMEKVEKLKDYLSHVNPRRTTTGLFERLVDQELVRQEKKRGIFSQVQTSAAG